MVQEQEYHEVVAVSFTSLLDWLAGRGFLGKDWRSKQKAIQAKIQTLVENVPADLKPQPNEALNFSTALNIRDKLAEGATRNFLGNLTGEARAWDKVVKAYQANNIHLGEAALALVRNGEFEIPHLRNRMSKQQRQLVDLEKRQTEFQRSINMAQTEYAKECKKMGIEGQDVVKELKLQATELPSLLFSGIQILKQEEVQQAISYYSSHITETQPDASAESSQNLSTLETIVKEEVKPIDADAWQAIGLEQGWQEQGIQTASQEQDIMEMDTVMDVDWDAEFDMEVVDPESAENKPDSNNLDEAKVAETEICTSHLDPGNVVCKLIEDHAYRNSLLADIAELQAFLRQRSVELSSSSMLTTQSISEIDKSEIDRMLKTVQQSWEFFNSEKLNRLLSLQSSVSFFKRLVNSLQTLASQEAKFYRLLKESQAKAESTQTLLSTDATEINTMIQMTKGQKIFIEHELVSVLPGKKIEITGLGKAFAGSEVAT